MSTSCVDCAEVVWLSKLYRSGFLITFVLVVNTASLGSLLKFLFLFNFTHASFYRLKFVAMLCFLLLEQNVLKLFLSLIFILSLLESSLLDHHFVLEMS